MADARITVSSVEEEFHSFKDIIDASAIRSGDTITLLTDVTIGDPIVLTKKCTIDLNEHYLFIVIPAGITVKDRATVTFINGKIQVASSEQIEDGIISQGSNTTVVLGEGVEMVGRGTAIHARRRGKLKLEHAIVSATGDQPTIYVDDADSRLTATDSKITSVMACAVAVRSGGNAGLSNCELYNEAEGNAEYNPPVIAVSGQDSIVSIDNCNIHSDNTTALKIDAAGTINFSEGNIKSSSYLYPVLEVADGFSTFTMSGGYLTAEKTTAILSNKMSYGDVQTIQISGGKVAASGQIIQTAGPGDHGIAFSGGAIKGKLDKKYLATGRAISTEVDSEGYYPIIVVPYNEDDNTNTGDNPFFPFSDPKLSSEMDMVGVPIVSEITSDMLPEEVPSDLPDVLECPVGPDLPDKPEVPDIPGVPDIPPEKPQPPVVPQPSEKPEEPIVPPAVPCYSVDIKNKIYIYSTPSRQHIIAEWRGVLNVYCEIYLSASNEEFVKVEFRLPGSGRRTTGYVTLQSLPKE